MREEIAKIAEAMLDQSKFVFNYNAEVLHTEDKTVNFFGIAGSSPLGLGGVTDIPLATEEIKLLQEAFNKRRADHIAAKLTQIANALYPWQNPY